MMFDSENELYDYLKKYALKVDLVFGNLVQGQRERCEAWSLFSDKLL